MEEPRKPKPKGIVCPNCNSDRVIVTHHRKPKYATTWRYRLCIDCKYKFKTEEVVIAKPKK